MSDVGKVGGGKDKEVFKQQFTESANLFKQVLSSYKKSDNENQKIEYKKVMKKVLNIMNKIARQCLRKEAQKQGKNLNKDYNDFVKDSSSDNLNKLNNDITNIKKSI